MYLNLDKNSKSEEWFKLFLDIKTNPRFLRYRKEFKPYSEYQAGVVSYNLKKTWSYKSFTNIRNKSLGAITRDDFLEVKVEIEKLNTNDKTGAIKNKQLDVIKSILNEAIFYNLVEIPVTYKITKFRQFIIPKTKIINEDRIGVLLNPKNYNSSLEYEVINFLMLTGIRKGELVALSWDQVRRKNGRYLIVIDRAMKPNCKIGLPKWNKKRYIVLPKCAEKFIHLNKKEYDCVFHTDNSYHLSTRFIAKINKTIKYLTNNDDFTIHAFRHNLNSYLVKNNVSLVKISNYFGWSSEILEKTQKGYTHLGFEDVVEIADMIDIIFNKIEHKRLVDLEK